MTEPKRVNNARGETSPAVRWYVDTEAGRLWAAEKEVFDAYKQPDCRTCVHYDQEYVRHHCWYPEACVNASEYRPMQPLSLWRKE